jgi:two-component system nitrate/nitrite response regulator NarL
MRLVLCDDQRMLAEALGAALQARGYQVLAVTVTATDGVTAVAIHDPDICLLGLRFPGHDSGADAARAIRQHHPRTKVLVLSALTDPDMVSEVMDIGVAGFISKDQRIDEIAQALDVVALGGAVFNAGLRRVEKHRTMSAAKHGWDELAPREKEILARIVEGQSTKQMARAMSITSGTVRMYVRNVLTKLGARNRLQVAALASREGLLADLISDDGFFTRAG